MSVCKKLGMELLIAGSCLFLGASMPAKLIPQDTQQTPPDNSKTNQRDHHKSSSTADQQKMSPAEGEITKKIRMALHHDKSLSTYAHNNKIISQDGRVTLKGPVRSEDEKVAVQAKAAGVPDVTNWKLHLRSRSGMEVRSRQSEGD